MNPLKHKMDNMQVCVCQHTFWEHDNSGSGDPMWHLGPCRMCRCKQLITIDQWLPQLLEQLEEN